MYKSFEDLAVKDEADLRDVSRVRRLYWKNNYGLYIAAAGCSAAGLGLAGLAVWAFFCKFSGKPMPVEVFRPLFGVGAIGGGMCLWMGWMFSKELRLSPLGGYLEKPSDYVFAEGRIENADYISDGKRSSARMSVKGRFGENGIFFEDFSPDIWSRSVADRGEEEGLKPGDDWYSEKGKRVKLPLPAWVLYSRKTPGWGVLVGIPAATAALLAAKSKK
ncbi:MAG: hypothetical protein PHV36_14705 [Elusimicrobiales bacterium]|nr:hypothetical protein [Elusimicrobiales bacterium]